MIHIDIPQGSIEWITNRLWRLTASQMKNNITSTGMLSMSKTAMASVDKLIAGIDLANEITRNPKIIDDMDDRELKKFMSHYNGDSFSGSIHTERGHDCEAEAIAKLSEIVGSQIQPMGLCVMGDNSNGVVACSPDGFEYAGGKPVAGAEVKSPCLFNYYTHVAEDEFPDDYKLQVHASMAICQLDTWHFGSYFRGKPLFYKRVKRDRFTDTLEKSLIQFREVYRARYDQLKTKLEAMEN